MTLIETGDLSLDTAHGTKQQRLQQAISDKIVHGLWAKGGKLPSTRKLATDLHLSRNTVISAYEQLVAEGYIESRSGSGYFVVPDLPEQYLSTSPSYIRLNADSNPAALIEPPNLNAPFAPGVPDLSAFPYSRWQKMLQRHVDRSIIMGSGITQGSAALRNALCEYLLHSRSVLCQPSQIIITSGAQQALTIALMATVERDNKVLLEQPGYKQVLKIINTMGYDFEPVEVAPMDGLNIEQVTCHSNSTLYVTPSNQYPLGTTLSTEQRLTLINWAQQQNSWIIEDDYDSEFQFAHRPYTSLQGLAAQLEQPQRIIYIGSFSKVMINGLRLGYMVVPQSLVEACIAIKDAIAGNTASHTQAALADFISEGDLVRHIRKMRRLYQQKHAQMLMSIEQHFADKVEVISQPAGLHVTVRWFGGISEQKWVDKALEHGIVIRPMHYYESNKAPARDWRAVVLGFGNVQLNDIDRNLEVLARCFSDC